MRIATRLLALAALLLGLGSTLLSYSGYDGAGYTFWEIFRRWDIITLGISVALCFSVLIALGNPGRLWDLLVAVALTFVFTNYAPFAVEYDSGTAAGLILGGAASALALVAGLLLLVEGPGVPRGQSFGPTAYATTAHPTAAHAAATFVPRPPPTPQPQRAPQSPAAGWYPDPGGSRGQRYWDGTAWTNDLRS